jgi:hypothetical protein
MTRGVRTLRTKLASWVDLAVPLQKSAAATEHCRFRNRWAGFVFGMSLLVLLCSGAASAQVDPTGLPIIGTWRINIAKSGPGVRNRAATWTAVYSVENGGIRQTMYDVYPAPYPGLPSTGIAPKDHTFFYKLDGKQEYKDPEGPNGEEQTISTWLVNRNMIYRQRQTKGMDDERVLYIVSDDGKTLMWYVWNATPNPKAPPNPNPGPSMVWDRVN